MLGLLCLVIAYDDLVRGFLHFQQNSFPQALQPRPFSRARHLVSATTLMSSINVIKEPTNPMVLNELKKYLDSPVYDDRRKAFDLFCNLYNASNVEKLHSDRALHCGPILFRCSINPLERESISEIVTTSCMI